MGPNRYIVLGLALFMVSFAGFAQELRDPTRPQAGVPDKAPRSGTKKSKPRSKMVLQTVLIGEDRQSAVISGRLMSVGDTISGFRLSDALTEGQITLACFVDSSGKSANGGMVQVEHFLVEHVPVAERLDRLGVVSPKGEGVQLLSVRCLDPTEVGGHRRA